MIMTNRPKTGCRASTHVERRGRVAEICRRIAGGERLVDILRSPDMPLMPTFHAWIERSAELASMYDAAKEARRLKPVRSHMAGAKTYTRELGREFCDRLCEASGLAEVCAMADMPGEGTVYRWVREEPEFAEWYGVAREIQAHRRLEMAWEAARHARWDGWRGAKLFIDTVRWQIGKLAPAVFGAKGERPPPPKPVWNVEVREF
jgi:hypothetical protein